MRISASYWWSTASLLQMAFTMVCSNAKQCTRTGSSFTVLGVFDRNDTASILNFQSKVEGLDNLVAKEPGCKPKVIHRELTLHDQMSALEVINATRNVFLGEKICYVVYSWYGRNGQLLLDYAIKNRIPVVFTIPNKVYSSRDEHWHHLYDPAKVISLNERSTRSTKMRVILDFLVTDNHKEFVAITGVDFDDMSVVNSLRKVVRQRNMAMVDWFIIPNDGDVESKTKEKIKSLQNFVSSFLIITNDLQLAETIVHAASLASSADLDPSQCQWILATDMDFAVINRTSFRIDMHIVYPSILQNFSLSDYVDDAIGMLNNSLKEWIVNPTGRCPSIMEFQRNLTNIDFCGKTNSVKFDDERQRVHSMYDISIKFAARQGTLLGRYFNGSLKMIDNINQYNRTIRVMILGEYAPYTMVWPKTTHNEPCKFNALPCYEITNGSNGEEMEQERCCTGFVIVVLKMVFEQLNIVPHLKFNKDGIAGIQDDNMSWKGIVNDIITEDAELCPDLFPNPRRSEILDFTDVYMPTGISLLVKESKRENRKIFLISYMRPFTFTLWSVFVSSVGVMIAFLWVVEKFSPSRKDRKLFHWEAAFRIDNAVCYVLQLAFGRPADEKKPITHGARLTGLIFGIAMLILMASYSANLAAFLIVTDTTTPVDSIKDDQFSNPQPGFKYGTLEGSYMEDFFKNHKKKYFKNIWHIMKKDNVKSLTEGVGKVLSGELDVLIGDTVSLTYAALNDSSCQLKVVGEPFAMSGASFAFKKGSRRLASFSTALRGLQSKGLTNFIQTFWVKKYTCNKVAPSAQLHLEDLSGIFLQLLIVIVLCILGHGCHLMWNKRVGYRKCEHENQPVDVDDEIYV